MIIGIGTDIIEIRRVEKAAVNQRFMEKCFSCKEREWLRTRPSSSSAGNFAGKEAVAKALLTGFRGFWPGDIEILRDDMGKPVITLYNGAKLRALEIGVSKVHVSITHSEKYAVAFAILE